MSAADISGQCLCGAVRIVVSGDYDAWVGACHCDLCRRWSGGLFLAFAARADAVHVRGPVTRHASTDFAERAFCTTCGSHLWMRDTDRTEADYDLMPGLFEATRDWPLRSEIYADRALASAALDGDHTRQSRAEYETTHPHIEGDLP